VAAMPPPPYHRSFLPRHLRITSSYLAAVAARRVADGLPHLDTG
jgi:hypothetical protein